MDDQLEFVPVSSLHSPWVLLRPVAKESLDYLKLRDSIKKNGIIQPLLVRPWKLRQDEYEVVAGMWRKTVAEELRLQRVPCLIKHGITDEDVLARQIEENSIFAETKPAEYGRQLRRILDINPTLTQAQLAGIVGQDVRWIRNMLSLSWLNSDIQKRVDRGEIPVTSAYMLAKIQRAWQKDYVELAMTLPAKEFRRIAAGVVKRTKEQYQEGRLNVAYVLEHKPVAHARSIKDAKSELENPHIGATLIAAEGITNLVDAFYLGVRWMVNLHKQGIEDQRIAAEKRARSRITETEADDDSLG